MRSLATSTTLLFGLLLCTCVPGQTLAATSRPLLRLQPEAGLELKAQELADREDERTLALARFVGLAELGEPITVHLASETSAVARRTPHWISGFAVPDQDVTVLFPSRVPVYPHDSMQELLDHELLHILLHRSVGGRAMPRWFSEGVSLVGSRGLSLSDRGQALVGSVRGGPTSAAALEASFSAGRRGSHTAYALSGAFVHHLTRRHGGDWVARVAQGMRSGASFEQALEFAIGEELTTAENRFFRRSRFLYTWLPWLSSGAGLWLLVTGLALVAGRRNRRRTAAIEARWAEEDRRRLALQRAALSTPAEEGELGEPEDRNASEAGSEEDPSKKEWIH